MMGIMSEETEKEDDIRGGDGDDEQKEDEDIKRREDERMRQVMKIRG